jgi:hypothetical protein
MQHVRDCTSALVHCCCERTIVNVIIIKSTYTGTLVQYADNLSGCGAPPAATQSVTHCCVCVSRVTHIPVVSWRILNSWNFQFQYIYFLCVLMVQIYTQMMLSRAALRQVLHMYGRLNIWKSRKSSVVSSQLMQTLFLSGISERFHPR